MEHHQGISTTPFRPSCRLLTQSNLPKDEYFPSFQIRFNRRCTYMEGGRTSGLPIHRSSFRGAASSKTSGRTSVFVFQRHAGLYARCCVGARPSHHPHPIFASNKEEDKWQILAGSTRPANTRLLPQLFGTESTPPKGEVISYRERIGAQIYDICPHVTVCLGYAVASDTVAHER